MRIKLGDKRVKNRFSIIQSVRGIGYIVLSGEDIKQENKFSDKVYVHSSGFIYNRERNSVTIEGEEIYLTDVQNRLLELLVENQNKILSYEELARKAWGDFENRERNLIAQELQELRKKIRDVKVGRNFSIIKNIYTKGYVLIEPNKL